MFHQVEQANTARSHQMAAKLWDNITPASAADLRAAVYRHRRGVREKQLVEEIRCLADDLVQAVQTVEAHAIAERATIVVRPPV